MHLVLNGEKGGGREDGGPRGLVEGGGGLGVVSRRKLFMKLWPIFKRFHFASSPPSPLRGGLSFLIYKEGEENESSLNKNGKGHFYVWA